MHGNPAIVAYGNKGVDVGGTGGYMLTYGDQSGVSRIVQPLGKSFSSGTVRIVGDARLPKGNNLSTSRARSSRRASQLLSGESLSPSEKRML